MAPHPALDVPKESWSLWRYARLPTSDRRRWIRRSAAQGPIPRPPPRRGSQSQRPVRRDLRPRRPRGRDRSGARSDAPLDRPCRGEQEHLRVRAHTWTGPRGQRQHDAQPAPGVAGRPHALCVDRLCVLRDARAVYRIVAGRTEHGVWPFETVRGARRAPGSAWHVHERSRVCALRQIGHLPQFPVDGALRWSPCGMLRGRVLLADVFR